MPKVRTVLLCLLFSVLLIGCQWLSQEESLAPPIRQVELQLLGWQSSPAADQRLRQAIEQILAATPTLSVTVDLVPDYDSALSLALDSDFPPDIVFVESGRLVSLASAGALQPIGDKIEANDDFYPVLRQTFTYRSRYYCPPREVSTLAIVYNRDMFDAKGLAAPTSQWGWQEFSSAVQTLTAPNTAVVGLALAPDLSRWLPFLYAAGGTLTDANETQMTLNTPEVAAGFHLLDQLWTDFYAVRPADLHTSWAGEAIGKQRAAMAIEGPWVEPYLQQEYPEVKNEIAELPSGPLGKSTIAFSSCLAVPTNAPHPAEAIRLINQLVSADVMRKLLSEGSPIPARISVAQEWQTSFPEMAPFLAGIEYAQPWRFFPGFDTIKNNIDGNLLRMYNAEIAVEDLLQDAEESGNQVLAGHR